MEHGVVTLPTTCRDAAEVSLNKHVIDVGSSKQNVKTVTVPFDAISASPRPLNEQNPLWKDQFDVKIVDKRTLTMQRTDSCGGWGQPLQISITAAKNHLSKPCKQPTPMNPLEIRAALKWRLKQTSPI